MACTNMVTVMFAITVILSIIVTSIHSHSTLCVSFCRQMSRLRLITFDVTNTLLRLRGSPGREYANVAKMFGVNIGHDELDRVYNDVWAEKKSDHPIYGLSEGLTTKQWWADFVRRVFCRAGYTGNAIILDVIAEELHDKFSEGKNWETMPFASDVLKVCTVV